MKNEIQHYFLEKDFNCAETTLHILNDRYNLQIPEEQFRLVSGFGGGCGCGMICGVLAGMLAATGKLMITERAHVTPMFKETCAELCAQFAQTVGSTDCAQLRPQYFREEIRCSELLEKAIPCFEAFVKEKGLAE